MRSEEWAVLLEDEPDNELVRFSLAKSLLDEKQWAAAVHHFGRLVRDDPEYALAWAFLARAALNAGNRDEARRACEVGMPVALRQCHDIPADELRSVLAELESEF